MKKLINKFKELSKKKKILFISVATIVFLLIVALLLYFTMFSKRDTSGLNTNKSDIFTADSYTYKNGKLSFMDEEGKKLGVYKCKNKDIKKCYMAYYSNEDTFLNPVSYVDEEKALVRSRVYQNRFVFIYDNKKIDSALITLYDLKNKKELGDYKLVKSYYDKTANYEENDYVIVKDPYDKYGILDLYQPMPKTILKTEYQYLGIVKDKKTTTDKKIVAKLNDKWYLINYFGTKLTAGFSNEIKDYNDNAVIINNGDAYLLVNYKNNPIFQKNYDFIDLQNDYIVAVLNNKLNIYNIEEMALIPTPISLNNTNYIKNIYYDKKGKLLKEEFAYKISLDDNAIEVTIKNKNEADDKSFLYNLDEGVASTKYDYYSYSNNRLYVYEDKAKQDLLGTYTCTNPNYISDSFELDNCYVAKDYTNLANSTPIYFGRYIFIFDAPKLNSDSTVKVKLYDLKTSKIMGNYTEVYTYSSENSNLNGVYFVNNDSYVIAKNKNLQLGVVKIIDGNAFKAIDFIYSEIRKLDKYLIAKNEENLWLLMDYEGNSIVTGQFTYIKVSGSYIATINKDNKLALYNYNNEKIINDEIQLASSYTFGSTNSEPFTISFEGNIINVTVDGVLKKYNATTKNIIE